MATIRTGNKAALLVVDVQVGVLRDAWEGPRVVRQVAAAVERARAQGAPVIWIQHDDRELIHGSPDWQWVPGLGPVGTEPVIPKHYNSAFEHTDLEETLAGLGVTQVVVAGAATNWCIRATAYAALDRGYDVTLLKDAHTTQTSVLEDGTTLEAESIIRDLNVTLTWLSYPGRTSSTASASDITFAT
ncbi:MAG: isochorismatase family protein [Opitutaceae bacterium]|nr:isochorismatase family protein [Opitutaceae bacterium]